MWPAVLLDATRFDRVAMNLALCDTQEDREMLDLAYKKYYRWKEIERW
jgi:hypothetical protein